MPANKKAAKKKIVPKKPANQAKKAVVKKAAVKKAPTKVKSKTDLKKNSTKKPAVKAAPTKKPASKPLKTKKVAPAKASKIKKAAPVKKVTAKKPSPAKKTASPKKAVAVKKAAPAPKAKAVVKAKPAPVQKAPEKKSDVKPVKTPVVNAEKAKKQEEAATKKQLLEQKSKEVLAINNNIPVETKHEISLSKIASISHSITNPIKRAESYSIKPEKEPNGKFELEFVVHASAEMIYEFISTPSGLSEWFCDDLNIRNGIYTFIWDDTMQQARLLKTVELQLVRFQWVDKVDGSYFELRIQRDDLTNDISLMITDFAETVAERESSKLLWHNQVEKLMHVLGSVF